MGKRKKSTPGVEIGNALALLLDGFDYRVESDDFILYELGRLVEEERVSLEDEEFRNIIDRGIRQHVEERPEIRAELSWRLRAPYGGMDTRLQVAAGRLIEALEDIEVPLRNAAVVVRTYTAYLFCKLQETAEEPADREEEARDWIKRWGSGEVGRDELTAQLITIGKPAAGPVADLLFESLEESSAGSIAAEIAVDILGGIRSSVSSRVLAHAIAEPMLDESVELKAYERIRAFWPLPRHYMLAELQTHNHEDLPYRWFQLLVEANEIYAVDLILEEFIIHGSNLEFHADLAALAGLLQNSRDPDTEEKIVQLLNNPKTPQPSVQILEDFLKTWRVPPPVPSESNPWLRLSHLLEVNRKYVAAAMLFDSGKKDEALRRIQEILEDEPGYPFAEMLKKLI
jgi:hypothetical protein